MAMVRQAVSATAGGDDADAAFARRRADLDWIRIGAFGLLILYHIALFFGPVDWHIDSRHPQPWIASALVLTNPWRLTLLFFVSGAALRFLSRKLPPGRLLRERSWRLLVPFVFGVIVLVPPQAWVEVVVKGGLQRPYLDYWARYFTVDRGLCLGGDCPGIPFNHLWFLLYIATYSAIVAVMLRSPVLIRAIEQGLARVVRGPGVLLVPIVWLALVRVALFPQLGITNRLFSDGYNHAASFAVFLLGFAMVGRTAFWGDLEAWRRTALGIAAASAMLLAVDAALPGARTGGWAVAQMLVHAVNQWATIAAILAFASRHLRAADTPTLRYLREGVFPFYLVHQTIIIVVAWRIDPLALSPAWEAVVLVGSTVVGCVASYEMVRRVPVLRPLFGLRAGVRPPPSPGGPAVLARA